MTNFNDKSKQILNKYQQKEQKLALIPPARIRTPSNQHQLRDLPLVNEQNMKPSEVSNPSLGNEVWSSVEDLFWDHMTEVQNKWSTLKLNDDIWAKLIYFEQNRRLAKAYVSAPVLTIDGSANGLDGFRIGLSGIDNTYRSLSSTRCLKSIGQGVKLKIDNQGNILIRKAGAKSQQKQLPQLQQESAISQCSVWIKDWPASATINGGQHGQQISRHSSADTLLNENCVMRELEKSDVYKLFDMRKFRFQLEKQRLNKDPNFIDWRQCVSIISFVRNNANNSGLDDQTLKPSNQLLEDPCWIMLINIIAIDMLKSSTICDRNNSSTRQQMGSSTLIHQHALLESQPNHHHYKQSANIPNGPLRTSSSASVLSPTQNSATTTPAPSSVQQQSNKTLELNTRPPTLSNNERELENNLMMATNERIKKLRTTNNRYRMSPSKSGSYYRKYQSTQQLSTGNNTIYTTFNSKYINSKGLPNQAYFNVADNSSTSDYNSVSRSTSSGNYWRNNQQSLYPVDSLKNRLALQRGRYKDEARLIPGQSFLTTPFEPKSISLSAFDLSLKPLDLKSSIKMNYDNFDECDDVFENELNGKSTPFDDQFNGPPVQLHSRRAIVSLNNQRLKNDPSTYVEANSRQSCGCDITTDKLKQGSHINHKKCAAVQGSREIMQKSNNHSSTKENQQKVSRSSIDSSSSSSGCADNDYFMSHSSSSMSSSSASNDRELFSQPASSSGIVCSGNTSDEYDDSRKIQSRAAKNLPSIERNLSPKLKSVDDLTKNGLKKMASKDKKTNKSSKRGNVKTLGTDGGYCCDSGLIEPHDHDLSATEEFDCDCPSIGVAGGCSCGCCCDCFIDRQPSKPAKSLSSSKSALCEEDSIYSGLPHPSEVATSKESTNTKTKREQKSKADITRVSSASNLNKIKYDGEVLDNNLHSEKHTKAPKQSTSGGWLEKGRYSKMFPKFIFSSSSNNRQVNTDKSNTQRKSSTLDRSEKFTLFKSNQDLA